MTAYLLALIGVVFTVFAVRAAVIAFRSQILHPILWAVVCLLCSPVTTFDLTNGSVSTQILTVTLLPISGILDEKNRISLVDVAFPTGALLFYHRRRKLIRAARPMSPADKLPE